VTGSAGITNLTNTHFYDNIRINAFGGRYYEPAATRQFFVRLKLQL
jgi:iron complex outermembrane receptor protein